MVQSIFRRLCLLLSVICGLGFTLIFLHSLIEPIPFSRVYAGIGTGAAILAILINWISVVKTDDYLIPVHSRIFFSFAIALASLLGFSLLGYFYFTKNYPASFLQFYGIAPAVFALIFTVIGIIRIKEAYALPDEYRTAPQGGIWETVLPSIVSLIAVGSACFLFINTIKEIRFVSLMETETAAQNRESDLTDEQRSARAEQFLVSAQKLQAENRYRSAHYDFTRAAHLGSLEAHYQLGLIYSGDGYFHDFAKAVESFATAAEGGHIESLYRLGKAYRRGEMELTPDPAQALDYLKQAATEGHIEAQKQLANMYNSGEGGPRDRLEAIRWFRAAAEQGDSVAQNDLAILLIDAGPGHDPAEGIRWLKNAAEQGVTVAEYNLARAYYNGTLLEKDPAQAFHYFQKLADKGLPHGFHMTGFQLLNGEGVEKDETAAFQAFQSGAQRGNAECVYLVGYCYLHGIGTDRDTGAALKYIETAARRHVPAAQFLLGKIYLEGSILAPDKIEAAKWLTLAVENKAPEAEVLLQNLASTLTPEELAQASRLADAIQAQ